MTISPITAGDIPTVSRLHKACLPITRSSKIGVKYLEILYRTLLHSQNIHITLVAKERGRIVGVLCATVDLARSQTAMLTSIVPALMHMVTALISGHISISELFSQMKFERALVSQSERSYATILTLFVDPDFRRRGVGKKLVHAVIQAYRRKGVVYLHVDTQIHNKEARRFYESLGFGLVNKIMDSYIFSKPLS